MRYRARFGCCVGLLLWAAPQVGLHAQGVDPATQYKTYLTRAQSIEPVADFGEQVSLRDGKLGFRNADIEIPGNGPTIRLIRSATIEDGWGSKASSGNTLLGGGWEIEIPRLKTMTADPSPNLRFHAKSEDSPVGWQVSGANDAEKNARCTRFGTPNSVTYPGTPIEFPVSDWWFGYQLVDDHGSEQSVFNRSAALANPQYKIGTASNWVIGCLPQTANGQAGEGFQAIAPDGTKYWFDYLAYNAYDGLTLEFENMPPKGYTMVFTMPRRSAAMLVTRIEDRFGNSITYSYSGNLLTGIDASDGRTVRIVRQTGSTAITVGTGASTRTWTYVDGSPSRVILPDGSDWQYTGDLYRNYQADYTYVGCDQSTIPSRQLKSRQFTVKAPSNATATFALDQRHFGRSFVPQYCRYSISMSHPDGGYALIPSRWVEYSLTSRTVSGPGFPSRTWSYGYSLPNNSWAQDCGPGTSCASTVYTEVVNPAGEKTRSTFSNKWDQTENKLLKEQVYAAGGALLRTVDYTYATTPGGGPNPYPWPLYLGNFTGWSANEEVNLRWAPLAHKVVTQQGVGFTYAVNAYDAFARPTSVTRSSPLAAAKTEVTTYFDDLAHWVLGQAAKVTINGIVAQETGYDSLARPITIKSFGKLKQTLVYYTGTDVNQLGTIATVQDGNGNTTHLDSWKRGIPRSITFPAISGQAAAIRAAEVDDNGWITSVTDETGSKTCYGYDAMGRIGSITYPSESTPGVCDASAWVTTTSVFGPVASDEHGIPAGHWRQTISTGNARRVTYFDGLWRPLLVREYDAGNVVGTDRYTPNSYDPLGRSAYTGYPVATAPASSAGSWTLPGVRTTYDALGRVLTVKQDSELGLLTTTTSHGSPFTTTVTNPRGKVATTSYLAWDAPTTDYPKAIVQPEGAYTDIVRDAFGKPTSIKRRNADNTFSVTRSYAYNAYQDLCRVVEPETGATLMGYDAAGNLAWSASGLPASTACDLEGDTTAILARKAVRSYDARNRITALAFADGQADTAYSYTPTGQLASIIGSNGGSNPVTTAYTYNKRGLLTLERVTWSTVNWPIGYTYDANGHLAAMAPGSISVAYAPNALGQPTQAGTYATNVSYFPNGAMKSFTYGNGIVHTLTQNARGLPDRSVDAYGTTSILDDGYDYDGNGNVAAISDGATGRNQRGNRTMTYDGLDRLTDVASPMYGTTGAHYSYDVLDNLAHIVAPGRDHWYCYDTSNRLTNVKTGSCGGSSVIGLGYDVQGNLANKNGVSYAFDQGNRLRSVSSPASSYLYDGHGRRWRDYTGGSRYQLYSQSGQLVHSHDLRKAEQAWYIALNGSLVAIRTRDDASGTIAVNYQHTDALGSPVAVTNASRVVTQRSEFEPYGELLNRPMEDGPGYTGHMSDAATGLVYMQQRYYDPLLGKFVSTDAVAVDTVNAANFCRYCYARNSPYKFTDPDGRDAIWVKNKDGTNTLVIKVMGTGDGANMAAVKERVESLSLPDKNTTINMQIVTTSGKGVNTLNMSSGLDTKMCGAAGECTNKLGGDKAHVNSDEASAVSAAAHEVLHFAGIDDQYKEGPRDANGNRTSMPKPGYDKTNIMTSRAGTTLKQSQLDEAKDNKTTVKVEE